MDEHPTKAQSHIFYAQMLREAGDIAGAANVMRHGRTVAAMDVTALMLSMQYLIEQVQTNRNMPRQKSRDLLDEASSVADAILAHPDTDEGCIASRRWRKRWCWISRPNALQTRFSSGSR